MNLRDLSRIQDGVRNSGICGADVYAKYELAEIALVGLEAGHVGGEGKSWYRVESREPRATSY